MSNLLQSIDEALCKARSDLGSSGAISYALAWEGIDRCLENLGPEEFQEQFTREFLSLYDKSPVRASLLVGDCWETVDCFLAAPALIQEYHLSDDDLLVQFQLRDFFADMLDDHDGTSELATRLGQLSRESGKSGYHVDVRIVNASGEGPDIGPGESFRLCVSGGEDAGTQLLAVYVLLCTG
ncbi:MAG: hypothetical protein AAF745_18165, partial [Planctomycetota bacterium]